MARASTIENDKVKQILAFDETPLSGDRQSSCLRQNDRQWKAAFTEKAIALFDRLYVKIVATLVIVVVLRFIYTDLFGQVEWTIVDDITPDYEAHQHNKSKVESSKWGAHVWNFGCAAFYGSAITLFTWMITYMDSFEPGVNPPTPVSPRRLRDLSGHTFHMGYVMAFVNGFATFVMSFWYSL